MHGLKKLPIRADRDREQQLRTPLPGPLYPEGVSALVLVGLHQKSHITYRDLGRSQKFVLGVRYKNLVLIEEYVQQPF